MFTNTTTPYRYPFTPYPKGWFYLVSLNAFSQKSEVSTQCFGEMLYFKKNSEGTINCNSESGKKIQTMTANGLVIGYFGSGTPIFPANEIPEITEFQSKDWLPPFHLRFDARVHVQEVAENALDLAHFSRIHAYSTDPEILNFSTDKHRFTVCLKAKRKFLGIADEPVMTITYYGLGIVRADIVSKMLNLKVFLTTTPVSLEHVVIHHWISIKRYDFIRNSLYRLVVPLIVREDFARDIPIWENKLYLAYPKLCATEGNILKVRQWAKQFY